MISLPVSISVAEKVHNLLRNLFPSSFAVAYAGRGDTSFLLFLKHSDTELAEGVKLIPGGALQY